MDIQNLSALKKYISLVEHKPGSIKFKIAMSSLSDPLVKNVIAEFKNHAMPGAILDTQINIFTQTITIKYDTLSIAPADFEEIFTTNDESRFQQLAETYYQKLLG